MKEIHYICDLCDTSQSVPLKSNMVVGEVGTLRLGITLHGSTDPCFFVTVDICKSCRTSLLSMLKEFFNNPRIDIHENI